MKINWQYGWNIVALTLLMQGISIGILIYCFALFAVPWLNEFSVSRSNIMLCIVILQIMMAVVSPMVGKLLDHYPSRHIVLAGVIVLASGFTLLSQVTAFWQLILLYMTLLPVGLVMTGNLVAQTLVARWFSEQRGFAMGISALGTSMGGFVFPLITGPLIQALDWRLTFLVFAVMSVVLITPLAWWLLAREAAPVNGPEDLSEHPQANKTSAWDTKKILTNNIFWFIVIPFTILSFAYCGVQFNLGAYSNDLGFAPQQAGLLISLGAITMIGGKLFFGTFSDRVAHHKLLWIAIAVLALAMLAFQGSPGIERMRIANILMGFAMGGLLPLSAMVISSQFGTESFGKVLGLFYLFVPLGGIGSVVAGWIYDITRSYDLAFQLFLFLLFIAALAPFKLRQRQAQ